MLLINISAEEGEQTEQDINVEMGCFDVGRPRDGRKRRAEFISTRPKWKLLVLV